MAACMGIEFIEKWPADCMCMNGHGNHYLLPIYKCNSQLAAADCCIAS